MKNKRDMEIVEAILKAAIEYFDVPQEIFIKDKSHRYAYQRRLCWYLIKTNTAMSYYEIGELFGMDLSNIFRGVETVATQKNVYRDIAQNLKILLQAANNFEKKFEWQLGQ